jgi:hypothetical protein
MRINCFDVQDYRLMNEILCISKVLISPAMHILRYLVDLADPGHRFFALSANHVDYLLGARHSSMRFVMTRVDGSDADCVIRNNLRSQVNSWL